MGAGKVGLEAQDQTPTTALVPTCGIFHPRRNDFSAGLGAALFRLHFGADINIAAQGVPWEVH